MQGNGQSQSEEFPERRKKWKRKIVDGCIRRTSGLWIHHRIFSASLRLHNFRIIKSESTDAEAMAKGHVRVSRLRNRRTDFLARPRLTSSLSQHTRWLPCRCLLLVTAERQKVIAQPGAGVGEGAEWLSNYASSPSLHPRNVNSFASKFPRFDVSSPLTRSPDSDSLITQSRFFLLLLPQQFRLHQG